MKKITGALVNNLSVAAAYDMITTIRNKAEQKMFSSISVTYEQAVYSAVSYLNYKEFGIVIWNYVTGGINNV